MESQRGGKWAAVKQLPAGRYTTSMRYGSLSSYNTYYRLYFRENTIQKYDTRYKRWKDRDTKNSAEFLVKTEKSQNWGNAVGQKSITAWRPSIPEATAGLKFTTFSKFVPTRTKPANVNPLGEGTSSSSSHRTYQFKALEESSSPHF